MKKSRPSRKAVRSGKAQITVEIPIYIRRLYTPKMKVSPPSTTRCPTCALLLPRVELMEHLLQVHKNQELQTAQPDVTINAPHTHTSPAGRLRPFPPKVMKGDKNLDATYGYHVIREQGRFGSHPSHDGFDDESEA